MEVDTATNTAPFTAASFRWPPAGSTVGEPKIYIAGPRGCGKTTMANTLVEAFIQDGHVPASAFAGFGGVGGDGPVLAHNGDLRVTEVQYLPAVREPLPPNSYVVLFRESLPQAPVGTRLLPVDRARPLLAQLTGFQSVVYDVDGDEFHRAAF